MTAPPTLFSFDVFGTVLDWRRGLAESVAAHGRPLDAGREFDAVVDVQGRLEAEAFRPYREITADSLVEVLGMERSRAERVGAEVGDWPPYPDSPAALRRLQSIAPCVAMTNSDRDHGERVQTRLGLRLSHWICAEDLGLYKPDPRFWKLVAERLERPLDRSWWHVSAYADYDLDAARALGLTTVFVRRPHARPGPADLEVGDLAEPATLGERQP
jgi:2-haloalkanoic acid dehalogenase type II